MPTRCCGAVTSGRIRRQGPGNSAQVQVALGANGASSTAGRDYPDYVPQLRIALAQVNPTVGDLSGNAEIVRKATADAVRCGADLVAFPEMMLTGYPVEDLALRPSFQRASRQATQQLAADLASDGLGDVPVVVGRLNYRDNARQALGIPRNEPLNAAVVLFGGQVVARYAKHHLPNYGVFDENRYFVPGQDSCVIRIGGAEIALAICEDLWQDGGPVARVRDNRAGLLLVLNGSPYEQSKDDQRLELVQRRAAEAGCPLAYVNLVGGQDELVFDGDSIVVDASGEVLARAPQFEDHLLLCDLDLAPAENRDSLPDGGTLVDLGPPQTIATIDSDHPQHTWLPVSLNASAAPLDGSAEMYGALVVGLRDYVHKNGFSKVALGLSGGIDSALVAAIAVDALGPANVVGVSMPSVFSSVHSKDDAADLAERTGLDYRVVPIASMVQAFEAAVELTGLAAENLQARVRGVLLMAISNQEGPLVLATSNKTEVSVGYSTIYGDAVGGFAPIKDVPKTAVWALSRWRNEQATALGQTPPIPGNSIDKPPSAELRPDQLDSDSLPDYAVLDEVLDLYVEQDVGADGLLARGLPADVVQRAVRLTDLAEYKRRQFPPGTKVSLRAFGRDRRQPITNRWRESM